MRQTARKQYQINKQGSPVVCDRGNPDQLTNNKEKVMNTINHLEVSGTLKAFTDKTIKTNEYGTSITGWLNQREMVDGTPRYVVGVGFQAKDPEIIKQLIALDGARQGASASTPVILSGKLTQWVAKSDGKDEFRYQLQVEGIKVL